MKVKPNSLPWTKSARLAFFLSSATIAITGCEEKRTPTSATTPPAPEAPIAAPSPEAPVAAPSPEAPVAAPSPAAPKVAAEDTIHTRVAKEIGEILGKPASAITAEKDLFKDLGADSLDAVEIVMALEEEFDLTIDDAAAEKMSTVADIVKYIRSKQ